MTQTRKSLRQFLLFEVLPLLSLPVALALALAGRVSVAEWLILVGSHIVVTAGITVGYHRLLTHRSFETPPVVRSAWAILGSMAAVGPPLNWVAVHRSHHEKSDRPGDPHSPQAHPGAQGFWHAHLGWMMDYEAPNLLRYARELVEDDAIVWVQKRYLWWVLLGLVMPAVGGALMIGGLQGAALGAFWGGPVRLALTHVFAYSINSVGHLWGGKPYDTADGSSNAWWLALPTLGEGWHNNHHAAPGSARLGHAWHEVDPGFWLVRLSEWMGLATKVKTASPQTLLRRRVKEEPAS